MKTAAILGASGYTGAEMIRLALAHPRLNLVALTGRSRAGETAAAVHPGFRGRDLPDLQKLDDVDWGDIDVAFACLPHGASEETVAHILPHVETVIDLSADFRLRDADLYERTYGREHSNPDLLSEAVYGLSEWARDDLPGARLVACPGCFPTCALLGLAPLLEADLVSPEVSISALTGLTGAGRKSLEAFSFSEVNDSAHPYGLAGHRHAPEMDQFFDRNSSQDVTVGFVPHLVPMNRGMVTTSFVELAGATTGDLREALERRYADAPFVEILPPGVAPRTRDVRGSNMCRVNVFTDRREGRAIVVAAIDNLTKGSSGQAVQNYNLTQGWSETLGLEHTPLFP